jgi:hypothetical protein
MPMSMSSALARFRAVLARRDAALRDADVGRGAEWLLAAGLAAGLIGWAALKLPVIARAEGFLFSDWGANLTVQALLDRGNEPTIDFFYPYGLVPLALGRAWFAAFGRTPGAYLGAVAILHALVAWGLARAVLAARAGLAGLALLVLALPYTVYPSYPSLAHGLEAVLLVHMLAEHARGRPATALALATACLFVKPSMAYIAGAILGVLALAELIARRPPSWPRALAARLGPAVLTGLVLSAALALRYRPALLLRTLLPGETAVLYTRWNYGFFRGSGRNFWAPPDARLATYLGTHRGFWIASSLVLLVGGMVALAKLVRAWRAGDAPAAGRAGVVVAAAAMHAAFVALFFGGEVSWLYYAYVLTLGTAAIAGWGGRWAAAVVGLALLALAADRALPREVRDGWRLVGRGPRAAGLWMEPAAADEWRAARRLAAGRPAAVLAMAGCTPMLYPQFAPDVSLFLIPGMEGTRDARRKADVLAASEVVVVPTAASQSGGIAEFLHACPEFRPMFATYTLVRDGRFYQVYRRPEPPAVPAR